MDFNYKISLIPHHLNKQQTIVQLADTLDLLSGIINELFERIESRIQNDNTKLIKLSERVGEANKKILALSGARSATQVFSSCKYPASGLNTKYKSLFSEIKPQVIVRHRVKTKISHKPEATSDKLHIYHVALSNSEPPKKLRGLGNIPADYNLISDTLLYNSGKNLYMNFVISDSLKIKRAENKVDNAKIPIGVAPASFLDKSSFVNPSNLLYSYAPHLGEVPSLDVPLNLPNLPGVANNLRYNERNYFTIAPSGGLTPNVSNDAETSSKHDADMSPKTNTEGIVNTSMPVQSVIEKEINDIPVKVHVERKVESNKRSEENEPVVSKSETKPDKIPEIKSPDMLSTRSSLMDAIRNAGGSKKAKLKHVEVESKQEKKVGMSDLMADLHSKLAMRRKGISGTPKEANQLDSKAALSCISSMIPANVSNIESNEVATEDDEWDV